MLERLLILSAVLFCIGLYGALSRRHLIAVLISIEIMFNAVNVALVAFSRFTVPAAMRVGLDVEAVAPLALAGQTFAVFAIVVAAAEMVMPRCRSSSIQSMTAVPSCTSPIRCSTPE